MAEKEQVLRSRLERVRLDVDRALRRLINDDVEMFTVKRTENGRVYVDCWERAA